MMGTLDRSAVTGERPMFPERHRRIRLNDVERLLEGFVDSIGDQQEWCDGDTGCMALGHNEGCRAAGDPLRSSTSLRGRRIG